MIPERGFRVTRTETVTYERIFTEAELGELFDTELTEDAKTAADVDVDYLTDLLSGNATTESLESFHERFTRHGTAEGGPLTVHELPAGVPA